MATEHPKAAALNRRQTPVPIAVPIGYLRRLVSGRVLPTFGGSSVASPQLENGHTRIANELLDALAKIRMSGTEWQVLITLFRQIYGWHRKSADISLNTLAESIGLPRQRVSEAINSLTARNVVSRKTVHGVPNTYEIQKNHILWEVSRKTVPVTENRDRSVTENRACLSRKTVPLLNIDLKKRKISRHRGPETVTENRDTITPPKSAPQSPTKGTRLVLETLPAEWMNFCKEERPDLYAGKEWQIFADYWRAQPGQKGIKVDWFATWRNWVRRSDGRNTRREG